jgi:hypothetical protein
MFAHTVSLTCVVELMGEILLMLREKLVGAIFLICSVRGSTNAVALMISAEVIVGTTVMNCCAGDFTAQASPVTKMNRDNLVVLMLLSRKVECGPTMVESR